MKNHRATPEMEGSWIKHYSSRHHILLVGDGDFSFSLCLARAFGSARNIVATSLDSYDELTKKYGNAKSNLAVLWEMGATLLHGVDATKMCSFPDLQFRKFDRIVYNLPHAGFFGREDNDLMIMMHQDLVGGFFANASCMLVAGGEIHVSHKITPPFDKWDLEKLASHYSLRLVDLVDFKTEDYPGYQHKRGSGHESDKSFPLGQCRTFKFRETPFHVQQHPVLFEKRPQFHLCAFKNDRMPLLLSPFVCDVTDACNRAFGGYLNHVEETFGNNEYDVRISVSDALKFGYETYMSQEQTKSSSGYVEILEELYNLSCSRSKWLNQRLSLLD